jgi:16S rRNA (guanine(966)-N(2))-methyltransferase RsmD
MFNMVGDVTDYEVLDLFAGSGSLSIEALSRGARRAVCVEKDGQMASLLRQNLGNLGLERDCVVLNMDVIYAIPHLARQGRLFDLILVDPPYEMGYISTAIELLTSHALWREDARQWSNTPGEGLPALAEHMRVVRSRIYGDTVVSLIRSEARQI